MASSMIHARGRRVFVKLSLSKFGDGLFIFDRQARARRNPATLGKLMQTIMTVWPDRVATTRAKIH